MGPKHKCALNRKDSFCLWVCEENYPKVNLFPDVLDISILCRRTEEVPRTSIKSEFFLPQKENLLCCRQNSISYQSKYHFRLKTYELTFITAIFPDTRGFLYAPAVLCLMSQGRHKGEIFGLCWMNDCACTAPVLCSPLNNMTSSTVAMHTLSILGG